MPFLGEQPVYDSLTLTVPYTNSANLATGQLVLSEFICPTSVRTSLMRQSPDLPASAAPYARSDYGGMDGERGLRSPTATNTPERGVMILAGNIALKDITDGASQTIQVAEAPEGISSIWLSVRNYYDQSSRSTRWPTRRRSMSFGTAGRKSTVTTPEGPMHCYATDRSIFWPKRWTASRFPRFAREPATT